MTKSRSGFTLVELMVVVVIIGVLSAIAIPAFRSYLQRSRTTEAVTFLGEIKQRQESYRAEFGQYCAVSGAAFGTWAPRAAPDEDLVQWNVAAGSPWNQLGARPDGYVRFVYGTIAGVPGTTPAGVPGFTGADFWFVSEALGDLDADGTQCMFENYSGSNGIFVGLADGSPNPAGWD
ncbi:MAG: prepilin-type N-terminal cleavage/methylation domain-containing protein [Sandaracinaceae bacterium]|nr:prepilin-type N-terminal cleavage/methylation domain-containing protein [Sandaracinaceae bacterium]